jgi:guanosine-3',5'-bis(diphosphate) 3'-pyrophosphohydrolase
LGVARTTETERTVKPRGQPELGLVLSALAFAAHKHRRQRRKDVEASPYINHPIALASVLSNEAGVGDSKVICAALLHDTIEDTETTPDELARLFGKGVCSIVQEVTDDKSLPKAARKQLQVEHAAHLSRRAKLVKLADKICNLRDISASPPVNWSLERQQDYFDWAKQVIDQVRGVHPRLEAAFDEAYSRRPRNLSDSSPTSSYLLNSATGSSRRPL